MPELNLSITISSFIAGFFTFFAPCTLPLVPAFLGIISGTRMDDLKNPAIAKIVRWQIFKNALFYVFGFSLVFVLFGVSFAFVSQVLGLKDWIQRIGGVLVLFFGLSLMGWINLFPLSLDKKFNISQFFAHASLINSFFLGSLFAIGWSPCVGPFLGSVLLLASTSGTVFEGALLLVIFSVGLGIPFLVTALLVGKTFVNLGKWGRALKVLNKIAGVFLVGLGVLLVINRFDSILNGFKFYFYQFQFFEVFLNKYL